MVSKKLPSGVLMRIVTIIQARVQSERLPGKVLKEIDGEPILAILVNRLRKAKHAGTLVVATTGSPQDDAIVKVCRGLDVPCFRGSGRDVLSRFYFAAKHFQADTVIRVTADSPFLDPDVLDLIAGFYKEHQDQYDFVANTAPPPGTFPDGMDVEVFSMTALKKAWQEAQRFSEREHVTFYFWKNPHIFRIYQVKAREDLSGIRLAVDYEDDFKFIKKMHRTFKQQNRFGTLEEIIDYVRKAPGTDLENQKHSFGEGWKLALQKDQELLAVTQDKASALRLEKGDALWNLVIQVIPGGAQTFSKQPGQFVKSVAPKMLMRGIGSRVWDLDGNEFIDFTLALGPAILGHAHPEVNRAAYECARDYFTVSPLAHPLEFELSQKIQSLIPCAEMVRFGKNGSDATAGAVRLARAYTGRDIIACAGYHGWQDWYIGSTSRNLGVPQAVRDLTVKFEYNRIESLEKILREHKNNVAAVILEPVCFDLPKNQFLHQVRKLCDENDVVLIFDEIITGFRLDPKGAQGFFGVTPDLAAFGKAIANGYPLSVLCGKADLMRKLEDVFFSFTFGGELPSIAAALKTLEILERDQIIPIIHRHGRSFIDGYNSLARELDLPFTRCEGLDFWPHYYFNEAHGFSGAEWLTLMQQELIKRGILTRSGVFISGLHSSYDIQEMLYAVRKALEVIKYAAVSGNLPELIEGEIIQPVIRSS
ncbi:MAG: aminotransferase class III-fold pyridoxal phosphate-dependent enzyme [Candidatus Omnitrophica bacterium]|nr:aminotransferase class III-fold pyridoxal phosphate-dependent enzyme [Candidatus Omnitrophota bacterium]